MLSCLILILGSALDAWGQDGTRFLDGLDTIPIIADLTVDEEPVIFDSPKGTIASVILTGAKPANSYLAVYQESLGAFGWACRSVTSTTLACTTSSEKLEITSLSKAGSPARLQIKLQPAR